MQCKYKGCLTHTNYSSGYCNRHAQVGYMLRKKQRKNKKGHQLDSINMVKKDNKNQ